MGKLNSLNLTERQKEICLLRVARDLPSERKIARRLRISHVAVHKHLEAAVRKYPALGYLLFPNRSRRSMAA